MNELDMFQYISGTIEKIGCWYLEVFSSDAGTQFTSAYFKGEFQTCGVHLRLASP